MRQILRELTPPMLWRCARALSGPPKDTKRYDEIRFEGHFLSWEAAQKASTGYDASVILQRTREALLKVKQNEAVYERDSVLFERVEHAFPILAGLLRAALASDGHLCIVDFGGSLGSSYFQCRSFLRPIKTLEWLVVEQPAHVACGRRDFETQELRFYNTVAECIARHEVNALLLSSVLQYLPLPYNLLQELLQCGFRHVLVDRTPFLVSGQERLTVQRVPSSIYPASYPAWFFGESKFTNAFGLQGYELVADFAALDIHAPDGEEAYFKGFIFEKEKSN